MMANFSLSKLNIDKVMMLKARGLLIMEPHVLYMNTDTWTFAYAMPIGVSPHMSASLCGTVWCRVFSYRHMHCGHMQYCVLK